MDAETSSPAILACSSMEPSSPPCMAIFTSDFAIWAATCAEGICAVAGSALAGAAFGASFEWLFEIGADALAGEFPAAESTVPAGEEDDGPSGDSIFSGSAVAEPGPDAAEPASLRSLAVAEARFPGSLLASLREVSAELLGAPLKLESGADVPAASADAGAVEFSVELERDAALGEEASAGDCVAAGASMEVSSASRADAASFG